MRTRNAAILAAAFLVGATVAAGAQGYSPYTYGYPYSYPYSYANPYPYGSAAPPPPAYRAPPAYQPAPAYPSPSAYQPRPAYQAPTAPALAPSAQWDYSRLGPKTDTPRYDYPGPALIGGCVCAP